MCCCWYQKKSVQDSSFYPIVPRGRRRFVGEIQGQRKEGWRVLAKWLKKNARKLAFESYIDTLKASNGWFFRSLTRNRLARRKRKKNTRKRHLHKEN